MPPKIYDGARFFTDAEGDFAEITGTGKTKTGLPFFNVTLHTIDKDGTVRTDRQLRPQKRVRELVRSGKWASKVDDLVFVDRYKKDSDREGLSYALDMHGDRILFNRRVVGPNGHTYTVREIFKRLKDPMALANVRVVSMQNRNHPEREFLARRVRVLPTHFETTAKPTFTAPKTKPDPKDDPWYIDPKWKVKILTPQRGKSRWWRVGDRVREAGNDDWHIAHFERSSRAPHEMRAVLHRGTHMKSLPVAEMYKHVAPPKPTLAMTRAIFAGVVDLESHHASSTRRRMPAKGVPTAA